MTTPPALPNLPGLSWSRHKKPGFSTRVAPHVSGREVRVALMNYPLYEFEAVYNGLTSSASTFAGLGASSLQSLMGFFLQLQGQFGTFLYTDPDDAAVTGQVFATGDGTTTVFTMERSLGGFLEPVGWVTTLSKRLSQRRRAIGWLYADDTEYFDLRDRAGFRRHDFRRLLLRVQLSLPRRSDGFRGVHVEFVEARQHEIPQREAMKPASSALIAFLNSARASPDVPLLMADAFIFTLRTGLTLCYTNVDVTFTYNGNTFLANSVLVDGLKYKAAVGLDVDQQQITVAARATDTVTGGAPFLQALRDGSFDGCEIERYRVFFSDRIGGTAIGAVTLFKGRLGTVDQIGRTSARLTVNSDLVLLDIDMPRNLYQPTCLHTLYDFRLHTGEKCLRDQRYGRRGLNGIGHQLVGRRGGLSAGLDYFHVRRKRRRDRQRQ